MYLASFKQRLKLELIIYNFFYCFNLTSLFWKETNKNSSYFPCFLPLKIPTYKLTSQKSSIVLEKLFSFVLMQAYIFATVFLRYVNGLFNLRTTKILWMIILPTMI
jgi:hypothetical protein